VRGREREGKKDREKRLGYRNPNWVSDFLLWEKRIRMRRFAPVRTLNERRRNIALFHPIFSSSNFLSFPIPSPVVGRGSG